MSLPPADPADVALVLSAMLVALCSIGAIIARKGMYMIGMLAAAAIGAAGIIATLGYGYIAAFHVVVYAGAGITLMALVLMFLGDVSEDVRHDPLKALAALMAAAAILGPLAYHVITRAPTPSRPVTSFDFREAVAALTRNWPTFIVVMVTLAAVIIEAVAIARAVRPSRSQA
ncbi:MAG: NADH-quinone oxidoreductase subunit J [Thermoproteota archaeon]